MIATIFYIYEVSLFYICVRKVCVYIFPKLRFRRGDVSMATTIIDRALSLSDCIGCEYADVIIGNTSKAWAPLKALVASLVAKIEHPDWDTRKHQTQIGGKMSLRTYDRNHVASYLFKLGMYPSTTEYALTRSFEKSEEFTFEYSGKISPQVCKPAFLSLVSSINTVFTSSDCYNLLGYILGKLKTNMSVSIQKPSMSSWSSLNDVATFCGIISNMSRGAVIPPIVIHSMYKVIHPLLWSGSIVSDLKEHTASDTKTDTFGDVEVYLDGKCIVAVEVKHNVKITDSIVSWFEKKSMSVPLRFVISTSNTNFSASPHNTVSCQFTQFVTSQLQQALVKDTSICKRFIETVCVNVIAYRNLHNDVKLDLFNALGEHSA